MASVLFFSDSLTCVGTRTFQLSEVRRNDLEAQVSLLETQRDLYLDIADYYQAFGFGFEEFHSCVGPVL